MTKFKIDDKVRLKKDIPLRNYNGVNLSPLIKRYIDASSFVSIIQSDDNDNTVKVRTTQGDYWIGGDALEHYQKPSIYKVGDKVQIKERIGNKNDYPCPFSDVMTHWSGSTFKIKEKHHLTVKNIKDGEKSKFYNGDDNLFLLDGTDNNVWHSSMFEPVLENSEQEIQSLISLKEGDSIPICGMIGTIRRSHDYSVYYLNFDNILNQEHFSCCKKLRELVPSFDKTADKFGTVCDINDELLFPEFSTIANLIQFVQAINAEYNSKQSTILKKSETYEIRFQKPKASSIRGSVPTGRAICGRRCKTAIELGHLSNKARHF